MIIAVVYEHSIDSKVPIVVEVKGIVRDGLIILPLLQEDANFALHFSLFPCA